MNSADGKVKPALLLLHHKGAQGCDGVLLLKEVASHLGIHGAQRVVQQVDVCVLIYRSKKKKKENKRCCKVVFRMTVRRVKTPAAVTPHRARQTLAF